MENQEPINNNHDHHHFGCRHCCGERRFHFGSFILGLILIFGGLAYFAKMNGWINYDMNLNWAAVWPAILIIVGLSMLSGRGFFSATIGIIMVLVILGLVFYFIFSPYRGHMLGNYAYSGGAPCANFNWHN